MSGADAIRKIWLVLGLATLALAIFLGGWAGLGLWVLGLLGGYALAEAMQ